MWFIIFGVLFILLGFYLLIVFIDGDSNKLTSFWVALFCAIGGAVTMSRVYEDNMNGPTAIDVYQGKTTLQITYEDSIPVDSVVVFKEKEK